MYNINSHKETSTRFVWHHKLPIDLLRRRKQQREQQQQQCGLSNFVFREDNETQQRK